MAFTALDAFISVARRRVPGLFLHYPARAQVSPALKAFIDVAREVTRASGRAR